MESKALEELVAAHQYQGVEDGWMEMLEESELDVALLASCSPVLEGLRRSDRIEQAATLAWAAIEAVSGSNDAAETLRVARPFLLAIAKSTELRTRVCQLYRDAYADCEGLDALIEEAGLAGGRPVRRALRTLDTCLILKPGDYLRARDGKSAARVEKIDHSSWEFVFTTGTGNETLGAVLLADRFEKTSAGHYRVAMCFDPDRLKERMLKDHCAIVVEICRDHGGKMDSDQLEDVLVPDVLSQNEWKKWWTAARTALRRSRRIMLDGRTPYYIEYVDHPQSAEDEFIEEFNREHDPTGQLTLIQKYVRACARRGEEKCSKTLEQCYAQVCDKARQRTESQKSDAGVWWLLARYTGEMVGAPDAQDGAVEFFRSADDIQAVLSCTDSVELLRLCCATLEVARPDEWLDLLTAMIPRLPMAVAETAANRLIESGRGAETFAHLVQQITASPIEFNEALLWLWDGPANADIIVNTPAVTLLRRILDALDGSRRSDNLSKDKARTIATRCRAVLSARKYERYKQCIADISPGVGLAIRTQIMRLDNLGRSVYDELLNLLASRFPTFDAKPELARWEREDILYVTEEGMLRRQKEIDHHLNVKMKENSRAIGEAAAKGDLSENSEYKFALEERDLLRARLAQMNSEMEIAKIFTHEEVPTDHIGIGTRATLKRVTDGEEYEFCLMGPWDSDHERGWINYKAPVAARALGKRLGDHIEFDHAAATGTYEIVELGNELLASEHVDRV